MLFLARFDTPRREMVTEIALLYGSHNYVNLNLMIFTKMTG